MDIFIGNIRARTWASDHEDGRSPRARTRDAALVRARVLEEDDDALLKNRAGRRPRRYGNAGQITHRLCHEEAAVSILPPS